MCSRENTSTQCHATNLPAKCDQSVGAGKPKVAEADRVSAFDLWYCYDYGEAPKVACAILLSENDI